MATHESLGGIIWFWSGVVLFLICLGLSCRFRGRIQSLEWLIVGTVFSLLLIASAISNSGYTPPWSDWGVPIFFLIMVVVAVAFRAALRKPLEEYNDATDEDSRQRS